MEGKTINNPLTSIRLYILSKTLKFAHLPDPGGLYDQSPILLQEWMEIAQAEGEAEQKKQEMEERKQKAESASAGKTPRTPRPRRR